MPSDPIAADAEVTKVQRMLLAPAGASLDLPLMAGELVQGRYELQRYLGAGGVGIVVAARHRGFDEPVALKFLRPGYCADPEAVRRFAFEARACFKLRSEHVARVFDVDDHHGVPFLAMELLDGISLRELQPELAQLAPEVAVGYVLQVCEALSAAHALGIIHRDIKPENLFMVGSAEHAHIRVLDFGVSKGTLRDAARAPTESHVSHAAAGTPPYMAPEQIRGAVDLDGRADLFALGCVLYELLSGKPAFERDSWTSSCAAVLEDEPPALHTLRPDVPRALSDVVARCLAKSPQARWRDAAELASALAPFASRRYASYPMRCHVHLHGAPHTDAVTTFAAHDGLHLGLHLRWLIPVVVATALGIAWLARPEPQPTLTQQARPAAPSGKLLDLPLEELSAERELPLGRSYDEDKPRPRPRREPEPEITTKPAAPKKWSAAVDGEPDVGF